MVEYKRVFKWIGIFVVMFFAELFAIPPFCTVYDVYQDHWRHVEDQWKAAP